MYPLGKESAPRYVGEPEGTASAEFIADSLSRLMSIELCRVACGAIQGTHNITEHVAALNARLRVVGASVKYACAFALHLMCVVSQDAPHVVVHPALVAVELLDSSKRGCATALLKGSCLMELLLLLSSAHRHS